ncbi:FMN-binding protein MioC [Parashewanella curva]|uniref:FMN-binding protein MioC n=1 Tax=Parashewanella curva TaxID=2338552 RepID=A0A3L8PZT8_9GAMM|nr:FMN-binding protein MioC [Parashewanella curva]RLV60835.1 FMN-binding protein MioC [Parashewanella curva]
MAKIEVIVGTTMGGAEYVSDELIALLEQHDVTQHLEPNLDEIPHHGIWLVVSSTHGAGELPDNIQPFAQQLMDQSPDLSQVNFAICAIGDSSYDTFCQGPEILIQGFQQLGATAIVDKIQIDVLDENLPEDTAISWLESWKDQIA